ncbi:hypothetical protein ACFU99_11235 [Streptomyces sp. NPDC057654]|uniref:hypothetical protein n=1 Tax=Streptomyces sp. NPDC057654 TaxID=3346196 RepID=UPI00367CCAEF
MMSATASLAVTHLVPLAASDLDKNKVTPGVLGFIVFALIGGAVWLLMKSMNKHMRKVDFDEPAGSGPAKPAERGTTDPAEGGAGAPKGGAAKGGAAQREAAAQSEPATPAKGVKGTKGVSPA